jgi:putative tryptophan/tyrosine transport system substrate-binding protein
MSTTALSFSRRYFLQGSLALGGLSVLTGCQSSVAPAQAPRTAHIGLLVQGSLATSAPNTDGFLQGLRELGYVEGQNLRLEIRAAEGREDVLPAIAAELVRLAPDVILLSSNPAIRAVQQVTSTIPIVFAFANEPVVEGLVASLAQPGGNATGLTQEAGQESAKRLELLKDVMPQLERVAFFRAQSALLPYRQTEAAAQALGVQLLPVDLERADELDQVLATSTAGNVQALIVPATAFFATLAPRILAFTAQHRLPAIYAQTSFGRQGGLLTFATDMPENYRRAAGYVDRILRGAKPGDLPIEQPVKYDVIINLKAAQEIGVIIPQSVLAQATELIQ